ncbi:hypothetical protein COR50_18360 [Chitinophaga caeni]|uniref:Iron dicitrate transport regulator FecR n=1 Tax=Chitinophaga caeni TaxID=2029983 RepID=A0A291QYN8_9BACT|nr:FecR domain-containing protein [Chitinophaga caeni]ATL48974.1 hypothetical protein COR50_18360 [Chitinophaga caeni]
MIEKEHIHQLMTEKAAGIISAIDEQFLDDLIENDAVVREKWEKITKLFNGEDISNHFERFEAMHHPANFSGILQERMPKKRNTLKPILVTAAAIAACIAVAFFIWPDNSGRSIAFNSSESWNDSAAFTQLKLSNGDIINLGMDTGLVAVGSSKMNNLNRTLSYHVNEDLPAGISTLMVPIGLNYKITLSDGTEVWLNSQTRMQFPFKFNSKQREVAIHGEAYLKVTRDAKHPFIVHLDDKRVEVLGTEFNVNDYNKDKVAVSLVNGSVKMHTADASIVLQPGKQVTVMPGEKAALKQEPFDAKKVLGWRDGIYYFDNARLEEICKVLPRWYGIKVEMDNNSIGNMIFSGTIDRNQDVKVFLENINMTMGVKYYYKEGALHLQ